VQHEIEDRLSEKILHGELNSGDHVHVDFKDGEFVFTTTQRALPVGVGVNTSAAIGTGPATPDLAAGQ
jgi:ATP-dependent Clp protease ATP-binding subunit ClpC